MINKLVLPLIYLNITIKRLLLSNNYLVDVCLHFFH